MVLDSISYLTLQILEMYWNEFVTSTCGCNPETLIWTRTFCE